ncbi:MAG: hypothetical protein K0R00_32 [Herbinix sp.]|jgi:hypothetical protein|nr:hypothetical protein [Herbinix sp.]
MDATTDKKVGEVLVQTIVLTSKEGTLKGFIAGCIVTGIAIGGIYIANKHGIAIKSFIKEKI